MHAIAIDGPAGAGKSTIAKKIANELGFIYVDTGAMYRAMALYFLRNGIDVKDDNKVKTACTKANVSIAYQNGEQQVILNGENVNALIRTEEVSMLTSTCSKNKSVRMELVYLQRSLAEKENVIMDGRDIGSFVLPDAELKIYLTADSGERARRRYEEQKARGANPDLLTIERDIIARDEQDMNREFSPLKQAEDAVLVDSSDMTIGEVVAYIIDIYFSRKERTD